MQAVFLHIRVNSENCYEIEEFGRKRERKK